MVKNTKYRPSFYQRFSEFEPSREALSLWLMLGLVASLIVFVFNLPGFGNRGAQQSNSSSYKSVVIRLEGELPASSQQDAKLQLSFPEIPYTQNWESSEYPAEIQFQSKRVPTYAMVRWQEGDRVLKQGKVGLSTQKIDLNQVFNSSGGSENT